MGKLIYGMLMSLDGYVEDEQGKFGWGMPDDEEVHGYVNELGAGLGTYLYGRKMYDTMVFWETFDFDAPDMPTVYADWARQWQDAEKVVYSRTLEEPRSRRTRIEREFDADAVRRLKDATEKDLSIDGPELAGQALAAGLVDELQMILAPVVVGGGKPFFPAGVRLDLKLLAERRFDSGVVVLRYAVSPGTVVPAIRREDGW